MAGSEFVEPLPALYYHQQKRNYLPFFPVGQKQYPTTSKETQTTTATTAVIMRVLFDLLFKSLL
jgi:hypothetical protein